MSTRATRFVATRYVAAGLAAAVVLAGCAFSEGDSRGSARSGVKAKRPSAKVTVLSDKSAAALALTASKAFFASAPVVVLVDERDDTEALRAAGAAVALGVPVLHTGNDKALRAELVRLGVRSALTFGNAQLPEPADQDDDGSAKAFNDADIKWVAAPADDTKLTKMLRVEAEAPLSVSRGGEVASLVGMKRGAFTPVTLDEPDCGENCPPDDTDIAPESDAGEKGSDGNDGAAAKGANGAKGDKAAGGAKAATDAKDSEHKDLPSVDLVKPLSDVLAMTDTSPTGVAATATAAAAGVDLLLTPGGDPRATHETVSAVAASKSDRIVGIGAGFVDAQTLGWRVKTAATGVELPGGGQLVFPGKRYVALYGTPSTTSLGVLGKQDVPATVARAEKLAKEYDGLGDDTVIPALEIIATVASSEAGRDGNYSNELSMDGLRPLIDAAHDAGQYVVIDLQPGRTSFLDQAKQYVDLLELPYVGLALDPEWNLGPDEVHMKQIGSTTAQEINEVVTWLADFTRERSLPQKMLVLHQFQVRMIKTVSEVDLSRSELAVLVHADGQGSQPAKQDTWKTLHRNGGDIEWWGWKNFYEKDTPMLTPQQTALVDPFPNFISYQ